MVAMKMVAARRTGAWFWIVVTLAVAIAVLAVGASTPDAQMFVALTALVFLAGAFLIPRAVTREPTIRPQILWLSLAAHVFGSLLRYFIIQTVYHGVSDANAYYANGIPYALQFRSLQIPSFPGTGTPFMNWLTGSLFSITGPTMLGGFVVCASLALIGSWYFYRAFTVSFPDGNHRLFALLIFLTPTMWYWTSSLGKDAIVMYFLGLATYGFALVLRSVALRGFVLAAIGLGGIALLRPPIAAALAIAAAGAFLIRPARQRSPQLQALVWLVCVPLLAIMAVATIRSSQRYIQNESPIAAFQAQQASNFAGAPGSNFSAPNPFSLLGFPIAIITVNFRPFPWEAGGPLPALAALEGMVLAFILMWRWREILHGLATWRSNGFVALVIAAFLALSVILSALANFGLLARQRTQVLPFLFMLPCMVRAIPRGRRARAAAEADALRAALPA